MIDIEEDEYIALLTEAYPNAGKWLSYISQRIKELKKRPEVTSVGIIPTCVAMGPNGERLSDSIPPEERNQQYKALFIFLGELFKNDLIKYNENGTGQPTYPKIKLTKAVRLATEQSMTLQEAHQFVKNLYEITHPEGFTPISEAKPAG